MSSYVTALEHFNDHRNVLRMTTGSANLDSLIDSVQEGQSYLFYGSSKAILEGLVNRLLVDCILQREKHGFDWMALYVNNVDYYQQDKSKVLNPERIAIVAKCTGIEPKIVFKNLFAQVAYNQKHQLTVAKQVSDFIESVRTREQVYGYRDRSALRSSICTTSLEAKERNDHNE